MECKKLSHKLLDLGWFYAIGTLEHSGMHDDGIMVECKTPFTYDYNNGVAVVYDEWGRPWIFPGTAVTVISETNETVHTVIKKFQCQRGAYVPHSNDGGRFMQEVLMDVWLKALETMRIA